VHIAVFGATLLFLLSTWYLVHAWLNLVIEGWLSPWDVVPVRPPQGTWERSLNDFFQSFPGNLVPDLLVVVSSIVVFLRRLVTRRHWKSLPLMFATTNLVFIALNLLASLALWPVINAWLPQPGSSFDAGYHRTWPLILVTALLAVCLLWAQVKAQWPRVSVIFTGLAVSGSCPALGVARLAQRDNCQSPLFVGYAPVLPISALIHQAGGLPKSSVEIQPGPALPASIRTYPVTDWNLNSVQVADSRPLWESIRDDDPTYSVKMELQIRYADGRESIGQWKTWHYGLVLCPLVIGYGVGPPGRFEVAETK